MELDAYALESSDRPADEKKWVYAAIDTDSKLILDVEVFSRRGTDPAAAFLHYLTEKYDVSDAEFLTDAGGYLTALAHLNLRGGLNYSERNPIEKWFQTMVMRIDRFHTFWLDRRSQRTTLAGLPAITITTTDRIKRSMDERQLRRFSNRPAHSSVLHSSSERPMMWFFRPILVYTPSEKRI